ncbi:MAG: endonuclease/exonuclease/phosphatase family protein [Actinomyces sp.]|uniref:endonuclease/exonuclease/phosphatase family protein n=1 Tax=Actinomyces sp. TaxID=29317 RepID=UPI0026DC5A43|nr:endonuclease/exonuclease/phosphatase family protein [Actinomyces sp.]MDO4244352.1 endonuclease/exonuclease/phosphatase family protein [Actinomyces sp.]
MLRVLTLNLQHGQPGAGAGDGSAASGSLAGADISDPGTARAVLAALADQIAELDPDVVLLQEVDHGQARSGYLDQTAVLAQCLGWEDYRFAATYAGPVAGLRRRPLRSALAGHTDDLLGPVRALQGRPPAGFGNALLTRHPVSSWHVKRLGRGPATVVRRGERALDPRSYALFTSTMRNMVAATIALPDGAVSGLSGLAVASTHLATRIDIASAQLAAAWGALATLPGPHILAGDLNMRPHQVAGLGLARQVGEGGTFPAARPDHRIDHVLTDPWPVGPDGRPLAAEALVEERPSGSAVPVLGVVGSGTRTFIVSDHAGTWVDLEPVA